MQTFFELGGRTKSEKFTAPLIWLDTKSIEGVKAWARDERTGEYVRVYEAYREEGCYVDGSFEGAWCRGNFGTKADAKRLASAAYRKINSRQRRAVR